MFAPLEKWRQGCAEARHQTHDIIRVCFAAGNAIANTCGAKNAV